jgi:hypothetical protein
MGRAVVGRLALTDRISGDLLPGHARREAARARRRRSNSIDQASGRCTWRSRTPAAAARQVPHSARPVCVTVAALMASHHPAQPPWPVVSVQAVLGYAERCGLRPPVGATGPAPPTGALFPPSPLGRRSTPSATDSATSGRIRQGPTTTIRQPSRGSDRPARCNRAATSLGSGGPRRAETGNTLGPGSAANPLAERDRA